VTPELLRETAALIKEHANPLVHALVDILVEQIQRDQEQFAAAAAQLALIEGLVERRTKAIL
jgi:hypothetical protein